MKGLNPIPSPLGESTPEEMHKARCLSRMSLRLQAEARQPTGLQPYKVSEAAQPDRIEVRYGSR